MKPKLYFEFFINGLSCETYRTLQLFYFKCFWIWWMFNEIQRKIISDLVWI